MGRGCDARRLLSWARRAKSRSLSFSDHCRNYHSFLFAAGHPSTAHKRTSEENFFAFSTQMNEEDAQKPRVFGLSRNVVSMGVVSFLNDLSSDMIYPFIPIFLTSVLGAGAGFIGLVEGIADATASVCKFFSGRMSDRAQSDQDLYLEVRERGAPVDPERWLKQGSR